MSLKNRYGSSDFIRNCDTLVPTSMFQPAVLAHYTGSWYQISGKFKPMERVIKLASYLQHNDKIQTGITYTMDPSESISVFRMSLRVLTDTSVTRATIGTDGTLCCLYERILNDWISMSTSYSIKRMNFKDYGIGIGISFRVADWLNK